MRKWLKENIFIKNIFIYILLAAIIFYIPAWGLLIYGFITSHPEYYIISGSYIAIWAGPLTPTVPVIIAIAIAIKQLVKRKKEHEKDETI